MKESSLSTLGAHTTQEPTPLPSIALAALVHIGLLAFLYMGVQWQSKTPVAVEAEVWDMTTREAAPVAMIEPKPQPVPEPTPHAQAPPEPVQKVIPEPAQVEDPEIILAQEKKRKLAEQIQKQKAIAEELKAEREQKREQALEQERKRKKLEEKELAKAQEEKQKQAEQQSKQEAQKQKLLEAKAQEKKEKLLSDKLYADRMRQLTGKASAEAGSGGAGTAERSTGNNRGDPGYAARVAGLVRTKMTSAVSDSTSNNPTVEYRFELLPDGSLRGGVKKLKSSGIVRFDEDVENAIRSAAPFPKDKTGTVPPSIDLVYKLKD